jgi:hypothetical protein
MSLIEPKINLPEALGSVITEHYNGFDGRYPYLVFVRTGSDGWQQTGLAGYLSNKELISRIVASHKEGKTWEILND